jgi:hypothetical protein
MNSWIDVHALWQVVLVGLLAGAGLPALFAVGLRALSMPVRRAKPLGPDSDHVYGGNPAGAAIAGLCFAIVLAAISYGIYLIVAAS